MAEQNLPLTGVDLQSLYVIYQAYGEDEADNSMQFLGISKELADDIWNKTLEYYFDDRDGSAFRKTEEKNRLMAYVRFLYLLTVLHIGREDLVQIRIEHTLEHLHEMVNQVDSLEIGV